MLCTYHKGGQTAVADLSRYRCKAIFHERGQKPKEYVMENTIKRFYHIHYVDLDVELLHQSDATRLLNQRVVATFDFGDNQPPVRIAMEERGNHIFVDAYVTKNQVQDENFIKKIYVVMPANKANLEQIVYQYIPSYLLYINERYLEREVHNG